MTYDPRPGINGVVEQLRAEIERLRAALEPFADIGLAGVERMQALQQLNVPFYDCPGDLVIYNDNMGHGVCVEDIRRARNAFYGIDEQQAETK